MIHASLSRRLHEDIYVAKNPPKDQNCDMDQIQNKRLKDFMVKDVIFITTGDSMVTAYEKMQLRGVRHLPVLDKNNEVVGVFTQTDLNRACPPRETDSGWHYSRSDMDQFLLGHFIHKEPVILTTEDTLGKAASLMALNKYSCIPVVHPDTKKLAGIVTNIDILRQIGQSLS